jgi:hypothetical protein
VDKVGTEAASRLIELAGRVEGFSDATNSYYQNFFSEGEQTQAGLDSISAALAEVGLAMPKTRGEFRALVQSLDLTTESGQKQFIALMGVNAAFAQLVPAVESATDKIKGSAKELLDLKDRLSTGIEDNLDSSAGPEAQLRRQYERIAESLNSAGIAVDVEGLICTGDFFPNSTRGIREVEVEFQTAWFRDNQESIFRLFGGLPIVCVDGNHDFVSLGALLVEAGYPGLVVNVNPYETQDFLGFKVAGYREIPWIAGEWNGESYAPEMHGLADCALQSGCEILLTHTPP